MKYLRRGIVGLIVLYALWFAVVLGAMSQSPVAFGRFMKYAPAPLVWGVLPAKQMWLAARAGDLKVGDPAPDFTLPLRDGSRRVALSASRGVRPVALIFGSYT